MKLIIFILMFLVISSLIIINNNDLNVFEKSGAENFFEIYSGWMDGIFSNVETVTGEAVKLNWFPE